MTGQFCKSYRPLALSLALLFGVSSPLNAAPFVAGQFRTNSQDDWGAAPASSNAAQLLADRFVNVYQGNGVELGIIGPSGFSMAFSTATAIRTLSAGERRSKCSHRRFS